MLTLKPSQKQMTKFQSHNNRFVLAVGVAAAIGLVGSNLDVPGNWLVAVGRTDLATPCYQLMTSFASDLHISNARTADALSNLAACYADSRRWDDAIRVQQEAINIYKNSVGSDSTAVYQGMARIGGYMNEKGNYFRAEMILNDALQGLERNPVRHTEATALAYSNLADNFLARGKQYEAITVLEKLLPVDESLMMLKQRSVDAYDRLGAVYARQGRTNLSKQTIEAGIALKERILGANNVQVASSYEKLSEMQTALGETTDARKSLSRAERIYKKVGKGS
jgi:tetratricopeptide (TPR) repeat protein